MKNLLPAMVLGVLLSPVVMNAQSWCPPGATWHYQYASAGPMLITYGHVLFEVTGDTVIAGQPTRRIDRSTHTYNFDSLEPVSWVLQPIFTHASDGVAWIYDPAAAAYDTLYHFNAVPGDHWKFAPLPAGYGCDTTSRMLVTDTGTTAIDGIPLRWLAVDVEFFVENLEFVQADTIYERLGGSFTYMLAKATCLFAVDGSEGGALRCYEDDEISYNRVDGPCDLVLGMYDLPIIHSVDIFPNPCTTQATLNWPTGTPVEQFILTDASGRVVRQWKPRSATAAQHTINVDGLASGMYTLQVRTWKGSHSGQICIAP